MATIDVGADPGQEAAGSGSKPRMWPQGRARWVAIAAVLVVVFGFGGLACLGTFFDHPHGFPGFWDYPSGVIGDGLVLPALLVVLIIEVTMLGPAQNRAGLRTFVVWGAVIGAVAGALVPVSWLVQNGPNALLWMMPRAHHFNTAGWAHLGYATVVTAIVGGLFGAVMEGLETGATNDQSSPQILTSVVGLGLGMLVLIGRDALIGIHAAASPTNLIGEVVVGVFVLSLLGYKARERLSLTSIWSDALIVIAFLVGLVAMIVGWVPRVPAVTAVGWAALLLAAGGAATMARGRRGPYRVDVALACGALLAGGLWRSESALDHHHAGALLWGVGGAAAACLLLTVEARDWRALWSAVRYGFFFAYCLVQFYLAQNLLVSRSPHKIAVPSLAVSDTAFDLMVFSLIQTRFRGMAEGDNKMFQAEYVPFNDDEAFEGKLADAGDAKRRAEAGTPPLDGEDRGPESGGNKPMLELGLLGFAVAIALFTLLTTAAHPLGLDRNTAKPPLVWILLPALAVALGIIFTVLALGRWKKSLPNADREENAGEVDDGDRELRLPARMLVLPLVVAGLWLAALLVLSGGEFHLGLVSAATGVVMFGLYGKSLTFNSFAAQTMEPGLAWRSLNRKGLLYGSYAACIAAILGFSDAWLVGKGLWQGSRALSGWWLAGTAVSLFIGSTTVFFFASQTLARGLPRGRRIHQQLLSRDAVTNFNYLDGCVYGLNYLICVILPLYAATRDEALNGSPLNVIASMFFLPGLLTAVIWGLENWHEIDRRTREVFSGNKHEGRPGQVSIAMVQRVGRNWAKAKDEEKRRVDALHLHWSFQRASVYGLMIIGLGYLAWVLLRF